MRKIMLLSFAAFLILSGTTAVFSQTFPVYADGTIAYSNTTNLGTDYAITVVNTVKYARNGNALADAEFINLAGVGGSGWSNEVAIELRVDDKDIVWGQEWNANAFYSVVLPGTGLPLKFQFIDDYYADNGGSFSVTVTPVTTPTYGTIAPVAGSPQYPGATFDININVTGVQSLTGASGVLTFEPSKVTYDGYTVGNFLGTNILTPLVQPDQDLGTVAFSVVQMAGQGMSGDGTVITFHFQSNAAITPGTNAFFSLANMKSINPDGQTLTLMTPDLTIEFDGLIVWPGDTDRQNGVDQADAMYVGIFFGQTGPARADATTQWVGQLAQPWANPLATNADCNGDGVIDESDALVVGQNWHLTQQTALGKRSARKVASVVDSSSLSIEFDGDFLQGGKTLVTNIMVADSVTGLFGISFKIQYSEKMIINKVNYSDGILGNDILYVNGAYYLGLEGIGLTRKRPASGVNGVGRVVQVVFEIQHELDADSVLIYDINANDPNGDIIYFGSIEQEIPRITTDIAGVNFAPTGYALEQNYPNPFNPTTTISYQLPVNSDVELLIYNMTGQLVRTLVSTMQTAANHKVVWDGRSDAGQKVPSGMYVYTLRAGRFIAHKKLILMK